MNRRSFLRRLGVAAFGLTLARHLPGIAPPVPALHALPAIEDAATGISMRFIRSYDIDASKYVSRFDLLMALPDQMFHEQMPVRFADA